MKMRRKKIALGGSAANPPHRGHLELVKILVTSKRFDEIIWIPSGERPDKPDIISADHRIAMTSCLFPKALLLNSNVRFIVRFTNVYGINVATIDHLERVRDKEPDAEITWYTGSDSVMAREKYGGSFEIEEAWYRGDELVRDWNFLILTREGFPPTSGLPKNFEVWHVNLPDIRGSAIRERIKNQEPWENMTTPGVAAYIKNHGLYGYKKSN